MDHVNRRVAAETLFVSHGAIDPLRRLQLQAQRRFVATCYQRRTASQSRSRLVPAETCPACRIGGAAGR